MIEISPILPSQREQLFDLMHYLMEHSYPQEAFNAVFDQILSRPDYHLLGAVMNGETLIG